MVVGIACDDQLSFDQIISFKTEAFRIIIKVDDFQANCSGLGFVVNKNIVNVYFS